MNAVRLGAALALGVACAAPAHACSDKDWKACQGKPWVVGELETPIGERWWPTKLWGAGDEAGSTNWYTRPEVVQRALAEAKTGKTYRLGRAYTATMPTFGERKFVLRLPNSPSGGPLGANAVIYQEEFLATEIGQIGTQFDGLGHIGVAVNGAADKSQMRYYNGVTQLEIEGPTGLKKNGIDKLHPIVARGILIDIAGAKGVPFLEAGTEITMADVRDALARQGLAEFRFLPGDAVLLRTGWGAHWIKDNARFNGGEPGIGMEVARWLSDDVQAGVTGSDTWGLEVVPAKDAACVFCVHQHLLVRHGIVNQENLDLDALAADRAWRILYLFSPVPIAGATGSIGSPVAVR
jgi:kynurenine formamidase